MRVLISVDMEGIAGVIKREGVDDSSRLYPPYCRYMTQETNAVIRGCLDAGVKTISVVDGHGLGHNLIIEKLIKPAILIPKDPVMSMMTGIKDHDGVIFLGYHGMAGVDDSFCAHTNSTEWIESVTFNSQPLSEAMMNAYVAGHYKVPVLFLSGTDKAVSEFATIASSVENLSPLQSLSFEHALSIDRLNHYIQLRKSVANSIIHPSKCVFWNKGQVTVVMKLKKECNQSKNITFTKSTFLQAYKTYRHQLILLRNSNTSL